MYCTRHLCGTLHCPSFLWGPLHMCVRHCSEGKRGVSIAGLLAVKSVHLAQCHQHPLLQRHWTKLNSWTRVYCLFGSKVEIVITLTHFQNVS